MQAKQARPNRTNVTLRQTCLICEQTFLGSHDKAWTREYEEVLPTSEAVMARKASAAVVRPAQRTRRRSQGPSVQWTSENCEATSMTFEARLQEKWPSNETTSRASL